jgi:hypothetical protein
MYIKILYEAKSQDSLHSESGFPKGIPMGSHIEYLALGTKRDWLSGMEQARVLAFKSSARVTREP